jgi:hypothetical protein
MTAPLFDPKRYPALAYACATSKEDALAALATCEEHYDDLYCGVEDPVLAENIAAELADLIAEKQAEAVAASRAWTPVEDRLPPSVRNSVEYEVWDGTDVWLAFYEGDTWMHMCRDGGGVVIPGITHWRELVVCPPGPVGAEGNENA